MCGMRSFEMIQTIGIVFSIVISLMTFVLSYSKDKRANTIEVLSRIRLNRRKKDVKNDKEYLTELEFFATGVNNGVYDIKIVKKMSASELISEYDNKFMKYISEVQEEQEKQSKAYVEYEKMILKLKNLW